MSTWADDLNFELDALEAFSERHREEELAAIPRPIVGPRDVRDVRVDPEISGVSP